MEKLQEALCLACAFDKRILAIFDGMDEEDRNAQADNLKVFEDNETFWKDYTGSGHDKKSLQTQIDRLNTTQKKRKGEKGQGEKGKKTGKKDL
jgi:hypothetical protein